MKKLLTGILLMVGLTAPVIGTAQPFSEADRIRIAEGARKLVRDRFLPNFEILAHYEAGQPFEALQNQLDGLLRDAFYSRDVLVFNEFRNPPDPYTTVEEYVKDCRIFSGGRPVITQLDLKEARYALRQTADGTPYLSLYLEKHLSGTDRKARPFRFRNLTEFRVRFQHDPRLNGFHTFRIAGISRVESWPPTAFTLTRPDAEPAPSDGPDLATVLANLAAVLKTALPAGTEHLLLERFTYRNCGITDALSDQVFAMLSAGMQRQLNVTVWSAAGAPENRLTLRGQYQEDGTSLRLVAELVDPTTDRVLATISNADLPLSRLNALNLKLKPDLYAQAVAMQDTLRQHAPSRPMALKLEIRTDRGRSRPEYWQDDRMFVEVRADRPCHLRLVYVLADGTRTLLENDFEIKPGQENRFVRIAPDVSFICSAPFGVEYLLAYAAEVPFCPLPTQPKPPFYARNEGGYTVLVGSMPALIEAVRCTRPKRDVAEDRIQITTREKAVTGLK
ncbi:DUF4384 domain-containing protein [Larkinella soli]|uniref:DUF4384 domain-containing protein n=1 Tax=Larkinella soli TaxID=1770527 RepID=UPI000FFB7447|nr:DUF4384 domain-containing protein [Larkinella soli]